MRDFEAEYQRENTAAPGEIVVDTWSFVFVYALPGGEITALFHGLKPAGASEYLASVLVRYPWQLPGEKVKQVALQKLVAAGIIHRDYDGKYWKTVAE